MIPPVGLCSKCNKYSRGNKKSPLKKRRMFHTEQNIIIPLMEIVPAIHHSNIIGGDGKRKF